MKKAFENFQLKNDKKERFFCKKKNDNKSSNQDEVVQTPSFTLTNVVKRF
jgi:hypothetical protein